VTFCAGKSMLYEITPADQQQSSRENQNIQFQTTLSMGV
jgi:hypothetical protein